MLFNIGDVNIMVCVGVMNEFIVNISIVEMGFIVFFFNVEVVDLINIKLLGVMVVYMEVLEIGSNVFCSEVNFIIISIVGNIVVDNFGSMEFNIINFGIMIDFGGNSIIIVKVVLVLLLGYVIMGDVYKVKIGFIGYIIWMDEIIVFDILCEN